MRRNIAARYSEALSASSGWPHGLQAPGAVERDALRRVPGGSLFVVVMGCPRACQGVVRGSSWSQCCRASSVRLKRADPFSSCFRLSIRKSFHYSIRVHLVHRFPAPFAPFAVVVCTVSCTVCTVSCTVCTVSTSRPTCAMDCPGRKGCSGCTVHGARSSNFSAASRSFIRASWSGQLSKHAGSVSIR
jgi:hypothetical protein